MSNVDESQMQSAFGGSDDEQAEYIFDKATLTLIDKSGIDKIIGIFAKQSGVSKEAARMQVSAMIGILAMSGSDPSDPVTSKLIRDFSSAAREMLQSGGGMTFIMDPEPGLSAKQLDEFSENPESGSLSRLGMSISYVPTQ